MSDYWKDREAAAQANIVNKSIEEIERQLAREYKKSSDRVVSSFIQTYNRVMEGKEKGIDPTPADLYKLNSYWEMQAQLNQELQKMGYKQINLLERIFTDSYIEIYNSILADTGAFSNVSKEAAMQVINTIWVADGLSWSERVWNNTNKLQETLNDELLHCVITGKRSDYLKDKLVHEFNVSYHRADSLVKTELSHIQTQAARQRYEDMGCKFVEVWAEKDERQCPTCGKLHTKKYGIYEKMPIPAHPRCRCTIVPVID